MSGTRFIAALWLTLGFLLAADWPMFRGPNGSGIAKEKNLPLEFGPEKNLLWKTPLPPGHSSPVIIGDRIFITAFDKDGLYTFSLERESGRILWRRQAPRSREQKLHKSNSPASSSPAGDGRNVYVFFTDFGLISYGPDGNERWRLPLPEFNNPFGMGASPVLSGDTILMSCDQESGSYFLAIHKDTGKIKWRVDRSDYTRGFSTPVLWKPATGPLQVLIAGSYRLAAYEVETGKLVWWVSGLSWQLKPTPVMDSENVYVLSWAGEADPGQQEVVPPYENALKEMDANKDGKLAREELKDPKMQKGWESLDLDLDGFMDSRDWAMYQSKRAVVNAVTAYKLGGSGDMTDKNTLWKYSKSLPNVPSPLVYEGVLYLMKEGGILTTLDTKTGAVLKQARLPEAPGLYFASPVASDGKVYTLSEEGKLTVLKAGGEWEPLATNAIDEGCYGTPALVDGRIYVRCHSGLFTFGRSD